MMMQPLSFRATHQASFDNVDIELAEFRQAALQSHATAHNSLRSLPIASHLHLVDAVPELPDTAFMNQLMHQLNGVATPNSVRIKAALMQWIIRNRDSLVRVCHGVSALSIAGSAISIGLVIKQVIDMQNASYNQLPALQPLSFGIVGGFLGVAAISAAATILLERARNADPFLNGPNVIDQNIVDPHELNNQPQNAHAASTNHIHVAAFQALQSAIAQPVDKTLMKERLLQVFDYLCEGESSDFKKEMIALNQTNRSATDVEKLQTVKNKVGNAVDFMISAYQSDQTPMHYPSIVTTSAALTHVWSCIEHLSVAGYEDHARLLTENLIKALYASYGLCNTGHVSRVLQAFTDTARFGFGVDASNQEIPPVITPQDFYTLNQSELNTLLSDVVNTHSTRLQLHDLEKIHDEDRAAYKTAATLVVKEAFVAKLGGYLAENHALVLRSNPHLQADLMNFLEADFAAFIDNARDEEDMHSVASFSPV